jgi:hypothetical protein
MLLDFRMDLNGISPKMKWTLVKTPVVGFEGAQVVQLEDSFLLVGGRGWDEGKRRKTSNYRVLKFNADTLKFEGTRVSNVIGQTVLYAETITREGLHYENDKGTSCLAIKY